MLHVIDSLAPGGAQTILKDYFESRRESPSLHLQALRTVARPVEIANARVRVHPSSARFSLAPLRDLRRLVARERISLLHCHLFRSQVFGYLLKVIFFPRIALVFHEHGRVVGREGESALEAWVFRAFLRLAWRRVDRFVCISDYTRSKLLEVVPGARNRAEVVANPIPTHPRQAGKVDPEEIRRSLGVPPGAFVIGFASRLVERKGWRDFLDAVQALSDRLPVFFLLAGDGEDRDKAVQYARELGIDGRGRMLGHVEEMARFYQALDCLVMPSRWEPHGLAHLEAQGFGVPIVVSRVPGLEATVHEGRDALLFEAADPRAMAECVHRIASDAALRSRLVAGGLENAARYSLAGFSSRLEAIHASL